MPGSSMYNPPPVLSVTQLVAQLKYAVENGVGERAVSGEIGSCKVAGSGHVYFTLKDHSAQLQCVLYRYQASAARAPRLREGMQVELRGRATVWEGRGSLQFVVTQVKEAGLGTLQQQFEELKRRLAAEGLFDSARKKPLPRFPLSVGLITSATGAVIQDMRHRLEERAPWINAWLYPVQVQGRGAELGIARAIRHWNEPERYGLPEVDYLIIARGGGSLEDLWCFNEEVLARAIAASRLPVVSAVGHETDFTIADFVADLRAPTPTAAIELTTPDKSVLLRQLDNTADQLRRRMERALQLAQLRLKVVEQSRLKNPQEILAPMEQKIDLLEEQLHSVCQERLQQAHARLEILAARLAPKSVLETLAHTHRRLSDTGAYLIASARNRLQQAAAHTETLSARLKAASPQNALDRGFALVRQPDGRLARRAADLPPGTALAITLSEGTLSATVDGTKAAN